MAWLGLAASFAGCATFAPPAAVPLSAAKAAADYTARSLHDEALRRFLIENLGHEPAAPWDFETLCWVAFYYHPSLEVARAQWATARAAQLTAAQKINPTLTLTPGYNTTSQAGLSPWLPAINFDFLLQTNDKRARQQDIARSEAEAARLSVVTAVWQVRSELRRALADAAISGRRVATLRAQADVQREVLSLLSARVEAGSLAAVDVSTTRNALLRAEAAAADAEAVAGASHARVATALGVSVTALDGIVLPTPPIAPALSADALAAAFRESLQSRSDIMTALAKYQSAQAALELEVAKQVPDLHLGPGYQWDQGGNKWTLALTLELPLFHRNEAPIAEATARRSEAGAQFIAIQAQAVGALEAAAAAQTAAIGQLDRARGFQAEMGKQHTLARQRVELGASDQLELKSAQLDFVTAETFVVDAESAAAQASGLLEDALQVPFPHLAALAVSPAANASRTP